MNVNMKSLFVGMLLVGCLLMSGLALAQEDEGAGPARVGLREDAPTYALRGPYWVGATPISVENGERVSGGYVWYPALNPDGLEESILYDTLSEDLIGEMGFFAGHALLDAEPDVAHGPYPLVVFIHGHPVSPMLNTYMLEHLASQGFVVAAVHHAGTTWRDQLMGTTNLMDIPDEAWAAQNAQDVLLMIDMLDGMNADGALSGVIDMEHIAAAGYSAGAFTAMELAGAQLDYSPLADMCTDQGGPWTCAIADEAHVRDYLGLDADEPIVVVDEPAVDALVLIDGATEPPVGPLAAATVDLPVLFLGSSYSGFGPSSEKNRAFYDAFATDERWMVHFENAAHILFIDCAHTASGDFYRFCVDAVWDESRAYDLINHFVTAFLLDQFYGDSDAHSSLLPDAVRFPGISFFTEVES